jgi:hypothetical protein
MDGGDVNVAAAADETTAAAPQRQIVITGAIKLPLEATAGSDAELDYRVKVRDAMREATGALQTQFGNDFSLETKLVSIRVPSGKPRKPRTPRTAPPTPGGKRTG